MVLYCRHLPPNKMELLKNYLEAKIIGHSRSAMFRKIFALTIMSIQTTWEGSISAALLYDAHLHLRLVG